MPRPFYRATLTGSVPFASFAIPDVSPSVIVTRRGALLDADTAATLKKALRDGTIEGVSKSDVLIEEIKSPAGSKVSADTSGDDTSDDDALSAQVETLTAERDEAAQAAAGFQAERDALSAQVETLTAAAAETDSAKLASGILDSLTVPELAKLAETRKVVIDAKATKADIVGALVAPQPAA